MKIKTQNLAGRQLDWAVAKALNIEVMIFAGRYVVLKPDGRDCSCKVFAPSLNWSQGGPIIEREGIETAPRYTDDCKTITGWTAMMFNDARNPRPLIVQRGDSILVAAMRCITLAVLGEEVEVPENLFSQP